MCNILKAKLHKPSFLTIGRNKKYFFQLSKELNFFWVELIDATIKR